MSDELFRSIVEELAAINYEGRVSLFETNEPLTDVRLPFMIRHVRARVPRCWQLLVTNGDYLTAPLASELLDAGLDYLFISSYNEVHYRHMRSIVRRFPAHRRARMIVVPQYRHSFATDNRSGHLPHIEVLSTPLVEPCGRVNEVLYVKPGGQVVSCFGDYFNEQIMGDAAQEGALAAWFGPRFRVLRRSLNRGRRNGLTLCSKCNVGHGTTFHTRGNVRAMSVRAVRLGIVVVGGSTSTRSFLPHWRKSAEVRHVVSRSGVPRDWPEARGLAVHADLDTALADPDVDCVFIASESTSHAVVARQALLADKHVLVEKPIALAVDELDALSRIAAERDLLLGGVFQWRFCDTVRAARQLIQEGALGSLLFVNCRMYWQRGPDYYVRGRGTLRCDGGGVLMKQAIHFVDLLLHLGGDCIDVSGFIDYNISQSDTEDGAVLCFRFREGLGTLSATTCASDNTHAILEVIGSKSRLVFSSDGKVLAWPKHCAHPSRIPQRQLLERQVENFLESVGDPGRLVVTAAECRRSLAAISVVYKSEGLPIFRTLPEVLQ